MKKYDLLSGLVWTISGTGISIESIRLGLGKFRVPGPGLLPFLSGCVLGFLGLILMYSVLSKGRGGHQEAQTAKVWAKEHWRLFRLPLLNLLALLGYIVLLEPLGFVITTLLYLFFLFKVTESTRWLMPLAFSLITVAVSYLLFVVWLQCQFPYGITSFLMR